METMDELERRHQAHKAEREEKLDELKEEAKVDSVARKIDDAARIEHAADDMAAKLVDKAAEEAARL
ncbi:hypothetical protein [uncultured Adlercreutzia sp.]|uniref:hypothetical protein n=1 Tax=uncultured Adlercreutzia sp. TaxID=875803 RepID=UPI0026F3E154|nr:hypothetical protein [uncultured Adlercreutzia sp.]